MLSLLALFLLLSLTRSCCVLGCSLPPPPLLLLVLCCVPFLLLSQPSTVTCPPTWVSHTTVTHSSLSPPVTQTATRYHTGPPTPPQITPSPTQRRTHEASSRSLESELWRRHLVSPCCSSFLGGAMYVCLCLHFLLVRVGCGLFLFFFFPVGVIQIWTICCCAAQ